MSLLNYIDYEIKIKPEALSLLPFKVLWKRDRTKGKVRAIADLSFIYFYKDFRSEFAEIIDEKERFERVAELVYGKKKFTIPEYLQEALDLYDELQQTASLVLLQNARKSLDNLSKYIANIDFDERDKNGRPIHDFKKITETFKTLSEAIDAVNKAEEKVKRELQQSSEARGKQTKNIFEDGL